MDWPAVISTSLLFSAIFIVLFSAILVGGMFVARDAMVHDYPPAIQRRYGPKSPRGERVGRVMSALMGLLMVGAAMGGIATLGRRLDGDVGFWPGFVFGVVVFIVANVFDLIVLDWWLFCRVQPRFMVLPGTEGMPEYRDWKFHVKVLVPRPIPWPLLLIPAYGVFVGACAVLAHALTG